MSKRGVPDADAVARRTRARGAAAAAAATLVPGFATLLPEMQAAIAERVIDLDDYSAGSLLRVNRAFAAATRYAMQQRFRTAAAELRRLLATADGSAAGMRAFFALLKATTMETGVSWLWAVENGVTPPLTMAERQAAAERMNSPKPLLQLVQAWFRNETLGLDTLPNMTNPLTTALVGVLFEDTGTTWRPRAELAEHGFSRTWRTLGFPDIWRGRQAERLARPRQHAARAWIDHDPAMGIAVIDDDIRIAVDTILRHGCGLPAATWAVFPELFVSVDAGAHPLHNLYDYWSDSPPDWDPFVQERLYQLACMYDPMEDANAEDEDEEHQAAIRDRVCPTLGRFVSMCRLPRAAFEDGLEMENNALLFAGWPAPNDLWEPIMRDLAARDPLPLPSHEAVAQWDAAADRKDEWGMAVAWFPTLVQREAALLVRAVAEVLTSGAKLDKAVRAALADTARCPPEMIHAVAQAMQSRWASDGAGEAWASDSVYEAWADLVVARADASTLLQQRLVAHAGDAARPGFFAALGRALFGKYGMRHASPAQLQQLLGMVRILAVYFRPTRAGTIVARLLGAETATGSVLANVTSLYALYFNEWTDAAATATLEEWMRLVLDPVSALSVVATDTLFYLCETLREPDEPDQDVTLLKPVFNHLVRWLRVRQWQRPLDEALLPPFLLPRADGGQASARFVAQWVTWVADAVIEAGAAAVAWTTGDMLAYAHRIGQYNTAWANVEPLWLMGAWLGELVRASAGLDVPPPPPAVREWDARLAAFRAMVAADPPSLMDQPSEVIPVMNNAFPAEAFADDDAGTHAMAELLRILCPTPLTPAQVVHHMFFYCELAHFRTAWGPILRAAWHWTGDETERFMSE